MRFLFLIIVLIFNIESVNANFLNKKPEGLLVFKDSNNHKKSPTSHTDTHTDTHTHTPHHKN